MKSENNKNPSNKIKKTNDIILPEISKTADNVTLVSPSSSNIVISKQKITNGIRL